MYSHSPLFDVIYPCFDIDFDENMVRVSDETMAQNFDEVRTQSFRQKIGSKLRQKYGQKNCDKNLN